MDFIRAVGKKKQLNQGEPIRKQWSCYLLNEWKHNSAPIDSSYERRSKPTTVLNT